MKSAVHEFFTNSRMDGAIFVHSWFYSRMVVFARVESLRGRISAFDPRESARQASGRDLEGPFESLLVLTAR